MGTEHPPRDKQAHSDKPSLWIEPADDSLALLENALRPDDPSRWDGARTDEVYSLLEENARLRGLLVQLSAIIRKNVVHAR